MLVALALLHLLASAVPAQEQSEPAESAPPAVLYADRLERDETRHVVTATGNAEARYGTAFFSADRIEYHWDTGDVLAEGNVVIEDEGVRIFASRMDYNVESGTGRLFQADGLVGEDFFITGREVERLGPDTYRIEEGTLTACEGDYPAWGFRASEATVTVEGYARIKRPSFALWNFPVAFFPYFVIPVKTERTSGFLIPRVRVSNSEGLVVGEQYFWAIDPHRDLTLGADYLSKRGVSPNIEYRYVLSPETRGELSASYLRDRETDDDLYELNVDHRQALPNQFRGTLHLDVESDRSFRREFSDEIVERSRRRTDSYLHAGRNWESWGLHGEARLFDSVEPTEDETFGTLPQITLTALRQPLGSGPLYGDFLSTYTYFVEDLDAPISMERRVGRLDVFPRLTLPLQLSRWFTWSNSVGYRGTVYDDFEGTADDLGRNLFVGESRIEGPKLSRTYSLHWRQVRQVRHTLEPVAIYEYVSDNDFDLLSRTPVFDSTDTFNAANRILYGLTNRFIAHEEGPSGRTRVREWARVSLLQSFDVFRERRLREALDGDSSLSDLILDIETHLLPNLMVNFDSSWAADTGDVNTANVEIDLQMVEQVNLFLDSRFRRIPEGEDLEYLRAGLGVNLTDKLYAEYAIRYDLDARSVRENAIHLEYTSCCWAVTAEVIGRFDETIFNVQLSLKGLGEVGRVLGRRVLPEVLPPL